MDYLFRSSKANTQVPYGTVMSLNTLRNQKIDIHTSQFMDRKVWPLSKWPVEFELVWARRGECNSGLMSVDGRHQGSGWWWWVEDGGCGDDGKKFAIWGKNVKNVGWQSRGQMII